jgi:hypothetical protein
LSHLQGTHLLSRNSGRSSWNRRKPSKPHLLVSSSKNKRAQHGSSWLYCETRTMGGRGEGSDGD